MVDAAQAHAAEAAAVVAVLTRAPSAGGKSRLFTALARPADAALLTALLLDTLEGTNAPGVSVVIAVEPAGACGEIRAIAPGGIRVIAQADGDLGERMRSTMSRLLADGARSVTLIGSDLPAMLPRLIAGAIATLDRDPAALVLGPARDGGYYLIASTAVPPVFDRIDWGSPRVLEQTIAAARNAGLRVHLLDPLADIDSVEDLNALLRDAPERVARRTRAWAIANGIGMG